VKRKTQGSPLAAGLIAFGVGWLISGMLPASEAETEMARQAGDRLGESIGPLKDMAGNAMSEIKEDVTASAKDAASQLKDTATASAQHVASEARGAAQEVAH
jgi:hypothetical protein